MSTCPQHIRRRQSRRTLTLCQFFLRSETKKLIDSFKFSTRSCSDIPQWPTAMFKHNTFFSWNLTVDFTSSTFVARSSVGSTSVGNFPALFRPGPSRRGICLIRLSEARKAWYFLANFLMSFLFLLKFL